MFIKLTIGVDRGAVFINPAKIEAMRRMEEGFTELSFDRHGATLGVHETPEQIMALMAQPEQLLLVEARKAVELWELDSAKQKSWVETPFNAAMKALSVVVKKVSS